MKINAFKQSFRSLTNTHIPKEEMGEFLSNLTVKNYAEFELDTKAPIGRLETSTSDAQKIQDESRNKQRILH
jgi:hypothetical protein